MGGKPLGTLVREYRLRMPMTQQELAEKAGLHLKAVQAIELGKSRPRPATIRRLAEALGVTARELAEAASAG